VVALEKKNTKKSHEGVSCWSLSPVVALLGLAAVERAAGHSRMCSLTIECVLLRKGCWSSLLSLLLYIL